MNRRGILVLVLVGVFLAVGDHSPCAEVAGKATPSQSVVKVFSETVYKMTVRRSWYWWWTGKPEVLDLRTGSGFLVQRAGAVYLVTAAHVVCGEPTPASVTDKDTKSVYTISASTLLDSVTFRVRVSSLSFQPTMIAIDRERDIAILTLDDKKLQKLNLRALYFSEDVPVPEQEVRVWGFPQTSTPQFQDAKVTAVQREFFVLNQSLDEGFSGGPVLNLNSSATLAGILSRRLEKQSRCVGHSIIVQAIEHFKERATQYKDGMKPPE
jgi:S1-C subfamily serine protease